MKGNEGWFYVIVLVIVCVSGTYACGMKGDGFFTFRFSNFQLYDVYACVCIPMCADRSAYVYNNVHLH